MLRESWQLMVVAGVGESLVQGLCAEPLDANSGVQSLPAPLTSCVILDMFPNLSTPAFLRL